MKSRLPVLLLALASFASLALLLYLARHQTFFNDEWWFILRRQGWSLDSFMAPHNEHWVMTMALVWKPLLEIVGLHSYVPYLVVMLLAHVTLAAGVYRICGRQAGALIGLLAAFRILFFGYSSEVFFQAFSFGLVGAAAAGTWAMALFLENGSRRGLILAAGLLLVAVATSGAGLFFVGSIGSVCLLYRSRRRDIWVAAPAVAGYAVWLVTYGRASLQSAEGATVAGLIEFVWTGMAATIGTTVGAPWLGGIGVVVVVLAVAWDVIRNRRLALGVAAGLAGLVAEFVIIGLARESSFGADQALAPRYTYVGAGLLLVAGAAWVSPRLARLVFWMQQRRRPVALAVLVAALPFVVLYARQMPLEAAYWEARAAATRAVESIFITYGGEPAVPADARSPRMPSDPWVDAIPPPTALRSLIDRFGSPLSDALVPDQASVPDDVYDRALLTIVQPAIVVSVAATMPTEVGTLNVLSSSDAAVSTVMGCLDMRPTGAHPSMVIGAAPGGSALALISPSGDDATIAISARGTWPTTTAITLDPGVPALLNLPDMGAQFTWMVRVQSSGSGDTRLCLFSE